MLVGVEVVVFNVEVGCSKALGCDCVTHASLVVTRVLGVMTRHTSVIVALPFVKDCVGTAEACAFRHSTVNVSPTQVVIVTTPATTKRHV